MNPAEYRAKLIDTVVAGTQEHSQILALWQGGSAERHDFIKHFNEIQQNPEEPHYPESQELHSIGTESQNCPLEHSKEHLNVFEAGDPSRSSSR